MRKQSLKTTWRVEDNMCKQSLQTTWRVEDNMCKQSLQTTWRVEDNMRKQSLKTTWRVEDNMRKQSLTTTWRVEDNMRPHWSIMRSLVNQFLQVVIHDAYCLLPSLFAWSKFIKFRQLLIIYLCMLSIYLSIYPYS